MIVKEEFLSKLRRYFSLNLYEVKIWTALLSRGVSTAGELSDIADVPRSRSYDVLGSLEKKGFVAIKLGKPIKYLAIPPKEVLERVKKQIEKKREVYLSKITSQSFSNLINHLQTLHENVKEYTENLVAIVKGSSNIQKHIEYLYKSTKKEIIFSNINEENEDFRMVKESKLKPKGVEVKTHTAGIRLFLADEDNTFIFPVSREDTHPDYDLGIWIRNQFITQFIKQVLNSV